MVKNPNVKKAGKKVDRLLTGIIVGGAIGSVVGMALAPKSGKENREAVKQEAEKVYHQSQGFFGKLFRRKPKELVITAAEPTPKKEGLLSRIFRLLGWKK